MRLCRFVSPVLFSLLLWTSVGAQPPQRDPQALAAMSESFNVHGGRNLVFPRGPQTGVLAEGTLTRFSPGPVVSYPFRVKLLDFDRVRWEFDTPQGNAVVVINNGDGWTQNARGRVKLPLGHATGRSLEYLPILALAHGLSNLNVRAEYIGLETLEGRNAHHLRIARPAPARTPPELRDRIQQMHRCELFIDAQTHSLQGLRYYEHLGDWRVDLPMDLVFSNYQMVHGAQIPFTVTRFLRGQRIDQVQWRSLNFSAPMSDLEFLER